MQKPYRNVWHMIGRGKAGWHASGIMDGNKTSSSGGNLLPYMWTPTNEMQDGYAREAIENALVYDADEAPYDEFSKLVIAGPMFEALLGEWEYELGILDHVHHILHPSDRYALTIESLKDLGIRSLSYIGVGIYEKLLRNILNVKIGHVHNGECVWEEVHATHTV